MVVVEVMEEEETEAMAEAVEDNPTTPVIFHELVLLDSGLIIFVLL